MGRTRYNEVSLHKAPVIFKMQCASCGAENPNKTRFCGECGSSLTLESAAAAAGENLAATVFLGGESQTAILPPGGAPTFAQTGPSPHGFSAAALASGTIFGSRYRIEGLLGEGGMGAVYKAYDSELDRMVALKVVRPELATSSGTMARFKQELLLASRISQKNILRIHDLGDANGVKFISMAYVEGTDLAGLLEKAGRLPPDRALHFTRQLCAALEAAHAEGVVHRDLKPQNILIDGSANVYVSDFGLAKSLEASAATMTRTGQVLGTPLYMSPEQVEAGDVDHRSDIYSLGLIIYEMFTAELPFRGNSAMQLMYQRVTAAPKDPREHFPEMPEYVARIILKCLAKNREERYQSAREILNDIDAQSAPAGVPVRPSATISIQIPRPSRRIGLVAAAVVALVLAAVFGIPASRHAVLGLLPGAARNAAPKIQHYLAVMPLSVAGDDTLRYIADGIGDALSAKLSGLQNVYVAAGSTVSPRLAQLTDDRAAKALGVTILVRGTVQSAGEKVSIAIKMNDVKSGKALLNREFAGVRGDLLTIEDQMFTGIAEALRIQQSNEERARTSARPTEDIDAYDLYLRGRSLLTGTLTLNKIDEAQTLFDQAVRKDPQFALAYAGLADAYLQSWKLSKDASKAQLAQSAAEQAKRLNDNLAEVHFSLGSIYANTGHTAEAIVELNRALQLAPNSDEALRRLGLTYRAAGQPDKAIAAGVRATELNPYLWTNYNSLATTYYQLGENEKSVAALQRVTALAPEIPTGWANLGAAYYRLGRWSDAIPVFQKAIELEPKAFYYSQLGVAYFFVGKFNEAASAFETAVEKDPRNDLFMLNLADSYRWSNQRDKAGVTYEAAIGLAYKALEVNPQNSDAMAHLALAYAKKGDAVNAAKFIRQAREIQKANVDYLYNEATIRTLSGDLPAALGSLKQALQSGYALDEAKADPELKVLRDRPEFSTLVRELTKKPVK